ncbi:MAG TPA: TonB-dependent receptor, partial [Thermoanaerobaculaceae bacterium]|nr:TonB-dependent receptor [Thermoanaerobaculaceae bacterium]
TLAAIGRSFTDIWSPHRAHTSPNASYSATYGDEWKLLGRPLGVIQSWSLARSFSDIEEAQRFFMAASDTLYDYAVRRSTASALLGGTSGFSYRVSRNHTVHLRGLYTRSSDDEVRTFEGPDHNRTEATSGTWMVYRNTRLLYVQRNIVSGALEGEHHFPGLRGADVDWRFSRSRAKRLQPDRRELTYDRVYYFPGDTEHWVLGSSGSREYGDLCDDGWGTTVSGSLPYGLGRMGHGRVVLGYDRQTKSRHSSYRRFNVHPGSGTDREGGAETVFDPSTFDGSSSTAWVEEATLDIDNYRASQRVSAGYLSVDVPLGAHLRTNLGVRAERGFQNVQTFDLFEPGKITREGRLDNLDWLPAANLTWDAGVAVNLRLAASRTLSRPDLNELSPSPSLEYNGGMQVAGNPDLRRATIDNYDVRIEAFPALSEVLAAGFFYKRLHQPIEQVIAGGTPLLLVPRNSDHGTNVGVELEARTSLGHLRDRLDHFSLNANVSWISSRVYLKPQVSKLGSEEHPLQGQAAYVVNAALDYASSDGRLDLSVLLNATGRRLRTLGIEPLPDVYEQPVTSLDASVNWSPARSLRVKLAGKDLLGHVVRQLQGAREVSRYRTRPGVSLTFGYGS